ncbi:hypothetical protein DIS24_g1886 [Lasiodiplodia hormozganensis]|uniref:Myb-like domain-containing protein n=1 Tax=Lasiodiplodia hormozganensis TaxID=869390 RepID=A0AA39Z2B5_9PEZI|nr:hypothetical protein DIS24_g1886 [Lasiodiplodia hormozganensis]
MASAKKGSDEHVAKKQKQKQDSSGDLDVGKIAARHLLQGDQEDVIQTFNGFKNEEKFGAFDVLDAEGVKFDHKGIAKDLFQQIVSRQKQPREAGKRWPKDEDSILIDVIREQSLWSRMRKDIDADIIRQHGSNGNLSTTLAGRTQYAVRSRLDRLLKTTDKTDESKLNAQLVDWPRPDDNEYEAFEWNTPQIVTDLRSGVARLIQLVAKKASEKT